MRQNLLRRLSKTTLVPQPSGSALDEWLPGGCLVNLYNPNTANDTDHPPSGDATALEALPELHALPALKALSGL